MAIFLVVGGLLLGTYPFREVVGTVSASTQRDDVFISIANGAENASALFGSQITPSVSAVSDSNKPYSHSAFSAASGAIKDPGYISSHNQ